MSTDEVTDTYVGGLEYSLQVWRVLGCNIFAPSSFIE
jgi:hypothetical protein